jgi:hypothetical protein
MLHEFLSTNREEIIARTREMVANRPAPRATQVELEKGIPLFLTQLIDMLKAPSRELGTAEIGEGATRHGDEMRRMGFTVGQIVHDYGGLCQAITQLAVDSSTSIRSAEFKPTNCGMHSTAPRSHSALCNREQSGREGAPAQSSFAAWRECATSSIAPLRKCA